MNVPKLRFKDFSGEYKNITFDKLANYKKGPFGSSLKKDMFVPKDANSIKVYEQQNAIKKDWTLERYFITKEYYEKLKGFTVKPGDIIVSCAGTIGEYYVLPYNAEIGVINQALMRISTNNLINQNYFLYIFDNMVFHFSKTFSNGSAIKNIPPFSDLKKQIAYIPSIEEQNKVAQFLSLLDKKIELQTKKIEALKLFKNGLFDTQLKTNGKESIMFDDFLDEVIEKSSIQNQYPVLSSTSKGLFLQSDYFNKQASSENNAGYKILKRNQLVLSPQNLWMGNININNKFDIGIVSPSYKVYNINTKKININYFNYWIKTPKALYSYLISSEQGASIVRRNLNIEMFNQISLKVPNLEKQHIIGNQIYRFDLKINLEEEKLKLLHKLKKGLMQNMFV